MGGFPKERLPLPIPHEVLLLDNWRRSRRAPEVREMGTEDRQGTGLIKRIVLFVLNDLWEGTYRRKRQRALYRHHGFVPSSKEVHWTYYPRYHWLIKQKETSKKH